LVLNGERTDCDGDEKDRGCTTVKLLVEEGVEGDAET